MTAEELFKEYPALAVYDFEVFKQYWLLQIIDAQHPQGIAVETIPELKAAYDERKEYVWIGYNSNHYDRFIMGALYKGISKADLFNLSQKLIKESSFKGKWGYLIEGMKSYDTMFNKSYSLKQLEAFMGHSIEESCIAWDYSGSFTRDQKEETKKYCLHDVEETLQVLLRSFSDFSAQSDLISTFKLDPRAWSMTKAQLTAEVLQCKKSIIETVEDDGITYDVERPLDFSEEEWSNFILPCIDLQVYTDILDFYSDADNYKDGQGFSADIMGVPHSLGLGGIHGALKRYHQKGGGMMHIDVTSYYPSMMIQWGLLTRRTQKPELFTEIYNKRLALKKAGKKREQAPYKIILNSTFGITNDVYSKGYDPCRNHEVCINGQLMLVMLLERLQGHCTLIQSNTDGIIISYAGYDRQTVVDICQHWSEETHMGLEYDEIQEIWQKDVNNYLVRYDSGNYDAKGGYVKFDSDLDRDLAITRKAVREGLIAGSADMVRSTIEGCNDLAQFQKICKIGSSYQYAYLGDTPLLDHRCFRVFAVKDGNTLYKQKIENGTKEKVANTPVSACIVYGDLSDPELTDSAGDSFSLRRLDLDYYTDTALKQYEEMLPES